MNWKSENGFALLALIAIMAALGIIAWSFTQIVSTQHISSLGQPVSVQSFYLAESGLQIGKKYYNDFWMVHHELTDEPDWTASTDGYYFIYQGEPLGNGTFDLGIKWHTFDPQYMSYGNI